MSKLLGFKPSGWRPAMGAPPAMTIVEDYAVPIFAGAAGTVVPNMVLKKSVPELAGAINIFGTAMLFILVPNKMWGTGALLGTVTAYATRKLAGE